MMSDSVFNFFVVLILVAPLLLIFLLGRLLSAFGGKRPRTGDALFKASCAMKVGNMGVSFPFGEVTIYQNLMVLCGTQEFRIKPTDTNNIKLKSFLGMTGISFELKGREVRSA